MSQVTQTHPKFSLRVELFTGRNPATSGNYAWNVPMVQGWQEEIKKGVELRGGQKGWLVRIYKQQVFGDCLVGKCNPDREFRIGE